MILNYLFIGFLFSFLLDYFSFKFAKHPFLKNMQKWTWKERIALVLTWPLCLIAFLIAFFKAYFKR